MDFPTREQFSFLGYINIPFSVNSTWHTASTLITTFTIDEILATKLRALYQRKKGRDLFDLWLALEKTTCSPQIIVDTWRRYMETEQHKTSKKQFELNLSEKMLSPMFLSDMKFLIKSEIEYDAKIALELVSTKLIERI